MTALTKFTDDAWPEYLGALTDELADYFTRLRPAYKTGILSNSLVGAREREYEAHRLGHLRRHRLLARGGPSQNRILRSIASPPIGSAWLPKVPVPIDDVEANLAGGAFGMNPIIFRSNAQAISDLQALLIG